MVRGRASFPVRGPASGDLPGSGPPARPSGRWYEGEPVWQQGGVALDAHDGGWEAVPGARARSQSLPAAATSTAGPVTPGTRRIWSPERRTVQDSGPSVRRKRYFSPAPRGACHRPRRSGALTSIVRVTASATRSGARPVGVPVADSASQRWTAGSISRIRSQEPEVCSADQVRAVVSGPSSWKSSVGSSAPSANQSITASGPPVRDVCEVAVHSAHVADEVGDRPAPSGGRRGHRPVECEGPAHRLLGGRRLGPEGEESLVVIHTVHRARRAAGPITSSYGRTPPAPP